VKTSALEGEVQRVIAEIASLLGSQAPPDLVLNHHCAECEFQTVCKQKAIEKDDLSLLAGITEEERNRYRNKGIFTVGQLSYTWIRREERGSGMKRLQSGDPGEYGFCESLYHW